MAEVTPAALGLTTAADREITDAMRERAAKQDAITRSRDTAKPTLDDKPIEVRGVAYRTLNERNPEFLGDFWKECRALYAGGPRLLRDEELLKVVFPAHANEAPDVYKDRVKRAFYIAYPGEIIDHLLAGFAQDPVRLSAGIDEKDATKELALPVWWGDFAEDVSPPGGARQPLSAFAIECAREMMVTQTAWVLVDLPARDPTAPAPESRLDEEKRGLLDPYLCLMPTDNVVDWQIDDETGELEWVLCYWRTRPRDGLHARRDHIAEKWLYWTREGWERYETRWEVGHPPKPDDVVRLVDEGEHKFGVVPFVRIQVPEGLYAMGKLASIAREHFNKRCAVSWAEYKALFAVLYEFMAGETQRPFTPNMPQISHIQQDARRATNQVRGQGYSQLRGHEDRAEYIGPDVAPFKEARESCAELMREMHRVMFSMALSANMDSAALQRSADSKGKDAAQIAAILAKLGEILREGLDVVCDLVSKVRQESAKQVKATGGEKFDAESVAASITEATELLNGVPQRSATFLRLYLYRKYKLWLGPNTSDKDLEAIRKELDDSVTPESLMMADASPSGPLDKDGEGDKGDDDPDDENKDEDEDDEPPKPAPKAGAKPRSRRIFPVS